MVAGNETVNSWFNSIGEYGGNAQRNTRSCLPLRSTQKCFELPDSTIFDKVSVLLYGDRAPVLNRNLIKKMYFNKKTKKNNSLTHKFQDAL